MDGVGSPVCVRAVGWGTRGCIVPRFVDKEIVEEEAEVNAVFFEQFLTLDVSDLNGVVDGTCVHVGAVDLLAEHLSEYLYLMPRPFDESYLNHGDP